MFPVMGSVDIGDVCCNGTSRYMRCLLSWGLEIWKVFAVMGHRGVVGGAIMALL